MPQPPTTLILFPLKEEAAQTRRHLAGRPEVSIRLIGIGSRKAERAIREALAETKPEQVFTCGFAGGLNPELAIGQVIFATESPGLRIALLKAGARPAVFLQTPRVVVTAVEKLRLRQTTGADAVEMESGVIRRLCREHGIPSATVRVISDRADEDLPVDFNALMRSDGRLDFPRLVLTLLGSPGRIGAMIRLGRNTAAAARRLALVLEQVLPAGDPLRHVASP